MATKSRRGLHRWRKIAIAKAERAWPSRELSDVVETLAYSERAHATGGDPDDLPQGPREGLRASFSLTDLAYVRRVRVACSVEPVTGQIFVGGRAVWGSSDMPWRERSASFLRHVALSRQTPRYARGLLLHHAHGNNYFHFFNNVVSKLKMAAEVGLDPTLPVLIPELVWRQPFAIRAIELGLFGAHPVVRLAKGEIATVGEAYLVKAHDCELDAFEWSCDALSVPRSSSGDDALFVTRGPQAKNARRFRNDAEICAFCERNAIRIYDPQEHSLEHQIETFRNASLVIAAHGAGLTNIMFRRFNPCRIVEIFNGVYGTQHYYLMSRQRGFRYRWIASRDSIGADYVASSILSIDTLARTVDEMGSA
jgi:hypothetical protein